MKVYIVQVNYGVLADGWEIKEVFANADKAAAYAVELLHKWYGDDVDKLANALDELHTYWGTKDIEINEYTVTM